jgi:CDP-paratose 2-epimerase
MRYLVTGGLGVIGSAAVRHLLDAGHEVVVIDAAEQPRNEWVARRLEAHPGADRLNIYPQRLETLELAPLVEQAEFVIHAAAHTGIPHSATDPSDDWASNVDATRELLEALRHCPRRVPTVIMSSVKPYQLTHDPAAVSWMPGSEWEGIDESAPLVPDEPYAASKAAQSMLAMAYARSYALPITTLRFSNLFGPGPCHGPRHGWLTWFCISAATGRPIEVQGGGEQARDMLYADDIVAALLAALHGLGQRGGMDGASLAGRVFNVGGGKKNVVTVRQVAKHLQSATGVRIIEAPGRQHEDRVFITDHRQFSSATGWYPRVLVFDGARRVLNWALENAEELRELYRGV